MTEICTDCRIDTSPCTGKRGCRHIGKWERYMVHDSVWKAAGMPARKLVGGSSGFLCIGCLEKRIGRLLRPKDFIDFPINDPDDPWKTPRLISRLLGVKKLREILRELEAA